MIYTVEPTEDKMIERFQEIKRIGTFKDPLQIASCGFNKHTVIFGGNSQGKMVNVGKQIGRIKALHHLVECVEKLGDDIKGHKIVIGHSDDEEHARLLGKMLTENFGELQIEYVIVNPTAGSHCGPDGVGVSFHSIHR